MHSCLLKVPIFQHLSKAEQDHIHEFVYSKAYKKGEYVQLAGEYSPHLLILNRGGVKVTRTSSEGNDLLIRNLSPGDYIGDVAVFGNAPADNDAIATADSLFCVLSSDDLHKLLRKYPELSIKIITDLSLRLKQTEIQIESLMLKKAEDRLLQALFNYSNGKMTFNLNPPKKDIASQIGMRPETLSRSLMGLQRKGLIKINGKLISLLTDRL